MDGGDFLRFRPDRGGDSGNPAAVGSEEWAGVTRTAPASFSTSTNRISSSNGRPLATSSPEASKTNASPSKISSSFPPTRFE